MIQKMMAIRCEMSIFGSLGEVAHTRSVCVGIAETGQVGMNVVCALTG